MYICMYEIFLVDAFHFMHDVHHVEHTLYNKEIRE